ncbi:MAG: PSD1 and planctomycete cytochrome C domain-containing protein [Planctomycetia bacterium]|nr:PSD1 and planctomycete cytochrome C domain-containing protein [Planctomycetia bacterium]
MPYRLRIVVGAWIVVGCAASVALVVEQDAALLLSRSSAVELAVSRSQEKAKPSEPPVEFSRDIKPLLAEHCIRCHGPDKAEAGLNLTDRKSALDKLASGAVSIVAGKPEAGELLRRVASHDQDVRMPPEGKSLSATEIAKLRRWIAEGAEYQTHWAYRPLVAPAVPQVAAAAAIRSPLDAFVAAKLAAKGIRPSPEAERTVQIKRLYFDLLGLLPKPEEVEAFVADKSSAAYEGLVDRLLASPHFGERWGRHWLDMARYADSDGYEKDRARPDAYVYRDWVIRAMNDDVPFDRFTIEQLAGDLLPKATTSQKIATAFNRQTLTNEEGGVDQEEYRINAVFDRTDTLGTVWLGLTLGCAKCHNHKYDEISQTEYYQMFAFFNGADEALTKLPMQRSDLAALERKLIPLEESLAARKREIAPAELKWEDEQRKLIMALPNTPLKVEPLEVANVKATSGLKFAKQKDGSYRAELPKTAAPSTDSYTLTFESKLAGLTGLRLDAIPDPELPAKGAGLSVDGGFVVTGVRAEIIDASGKKLRPLTLQRATADAIDAGFFAADVLGTTAVKKTDKAKQADKDKKKGWHLGPKFKNTHYLQVRFMAPLTLAAGERVAIELEQSYGESRTLGRFRLQALTGDAAELHIPFDVATALKMYPEKRVAKMKETLFDHYADQDEKVRTLQAQIEAVLTESKVEMLPVRTIATPLHDRKTFRFERGDFLSPTEEVRSNLLHVLPKPKADGKPYSRLDLARWLVSNENHLTPRVVANQIWARLFGVGIVRTVNDFGVRGDVPSHPELLDWLAVELRSGSGAGMVNRSAKPWSLKSFLKVILMSATYRQASTHRPELVDTDPQNTLLSRQNRLRVEGEIVRDLALSAGGLLNAKIGGPSVFPPMPADLAKLSYANSFSWTDSTGDDRYRRGMYTFFKRTVPHPTLMTFDCPDANTTCVNRTVSNTPLQALALLNNDSFVEASQAMAKRLLANDAGPAADASKGKSAAAKVDDRARLAQAMRLCLARPPEADELDRLQGLLDDARSYYQAAPQEAVKMNGRFADAKISATEAAAWTATVRVLLNLDEFITRE